MAGCKLARSPIFLPVSIRNLPKLQLASAAKPQLCAAKVSPSTIFSLFLLSISLSSPLSEAWFAGHAFLLPPSSSSFCDSPGLR
ncbi:hypothetical protein LY76DRAFT_347684 [Colletotrichum caudatum]|nr:hypothetical protein LY76DRAFT_347684 [Colletotrichum caudatum]